MSTHLYFCNFAVAGKKSEVGTPSNLGVILENITVLIETQISIYLQSKDIWFLGLPPDLIKDQLSYDRPDEEIL